MTLRNHTLYNKSNCVSKMPGKKKGKKGKKKKAMAGGEMADVCVKKLMKRYEQNCKDCNSVMPLDLKKTMKACIENCQILSKAILEASTVEQSDDPRVCLQPFIQTVREERYTYLKDLHVWNIPLVHKDMATLALLVEKGFYPLRLIDLMDCLIDSYSIKRLSESFMLCQTLTTLILDYNEFGDKGCEGVCHGLEKNHTILSLSMNYCALGVASGALLGHIIQTTVLRELYLDGNDLECDGAMELIKACVLQAEEESAARQEAARLKEQQEAERILAEQENRYGSYARTGVSDSEAGDRIGSAASSKGGDGPGASKGKKGKKKKGKKKKKKPAPPPEPGPWIHKLHLADNGIDGLGSSPHFAPVICMRLFKQLLLHSTCLEELDLEDNLIGDMGGQEIKEGLEKRKEADLPSVKVRTTHRMSSETFAAICKLGSGLKKKKKKKGKKKKK